MSPRTKRVLLGIGYGVVLFELGKLIASGIGVTRTLAVLIGMLCVILEYIHDYRAARVEGQRP